MVLRIFYHNLKKSQVTEATNSKKSVALVNVVLFDFNAEDVFVGR